MEKATKKVKSFFLCFWKHNFNYICATNQNVCFFTSLSLVIACHTNKFYYKQKQIFFFNFCFCLYLTKTQQRMDVSSAFFSIVSPANIKVFSYILHEHVACECMQCTQCSYVINYIFQFITTTKKKNYKTYQWRHIRSTTKYIHFFADLFLLSLHISSRQQWINSFPLKKRQGNVSKTLIVYRI